MLTNDDLLRAAEVQDKTWMEQWMEEPDPTTITDVDDDTKNKRTDDGEWGEMARKALDGWARENPY